MAFTVVTDAATGIGLDSATLNGHWSEADEFDNVVKYLWGYNSPDSPIGETTRDGESGSYAYGLSSLANDRSIYFDFRCARGTFPTNFVGGGELNFKTLAPVMSFGTPHSSSIGITTANIDIDFNPNTYESSAYVEAKYRVKAGPGAWVSGGVVYNQQGFSNRNLQYNLSGLVGGETYQYKFVATRDAQNDNSLESSIGEFTTLSNPIEITIAETATFTETIEFTKNSNKQITITETVTLTETVEVLPGVQSEKVFIQPVMSGSSELG